jgi:hypothetical protein
MSMYAFKDERKTDKVYAADFLEEHLSTLYFCPDKECTARMKLCEREGMRAEMEVVPALVQAYIDENARTALDQDEYRRRYDALAERFEAVKARLAAADAAISDKESRGRRWMPSSRASGRRTAP